MSPTLRITLSQDGWDHKAEYDTNDEETQAALEFAAEKKLDTAHLLEQIWASAGILWGPIQYGLVGKAESKAEEAIETLKSEASSRLAPSEGFYIGTADQKRTDRFIVSTDPVIDCSTKHLVVYKYDLSLAGDATLDETARDLPMR